VDCGAVHWRSALEHNPLGNYHKGCEPQPLEVKNIKMYSSVEKALST